MGEVVPIPVGPGAGPATAQAQAANKWAMPQEPLDWGSRCCPYVARRPRMCL